MNRDLIYEAIANFQTTTGIFAELCSMSSEPKESTLDGKISFSFNDHTFKLPFIVKKKLTMSLIPKLQNTLKEGILVIFESASKSIKNYLKSVDINYLESTGNIYLHQKNIYLFVDSNKKLKKEVHKPDNAFSKAGLKVIYQLLVNPKNIDLTYRELGRISGVSIDTVGRVYKELLRDNYIVKISERKFKIHHQERLFHDWVTLFNRILRPRLKKKSFRFRSNENLAALLSKKIDGKIGGELAAEKVSNYLIAEKANIYVQDSFIELALKLELIPETNGPITMVEQFWKEEKPSFNNLGTLASLVLIYADLVADPKPRNLETAKIIYDQYVNDTL